MTFEDRLDNILVKHKELGEALLNPRELGQNFAKISKEYSDLEEIVISIQKYKKAQKEILGLQEIINDPDSGKEMKNIAENELYDLEKHIPELQKNIEIALLPTDEADEKNAILEIRAGTGGEEAALFAGVLLKMYQKYAERKGWKTEIINASETEIGGFKEVSMNIIGKNVFSRLKFESGVHRVQRVPETEAQGRVHTSAATVAVLPEAEDIDVHIDDKDLRIDIFRASGPGGQCVNTTDSAVRIVHMPTGITVQQQDEKSQHKNKEKAMKVLRSRLYEAERQKIQEERDADRKEQIGSGDRSERIRTYNYPQNRVTDHRVNLTLYKIDQITNEGDLDEIIDTLTANHQARMLTQD
ncbi:peptide chain release factor 1 [Pseudomonadota bacterium]